MGLCSWVCSARVIGQMFQIDKWPRWSLVKESGSQSSLVIQYMQLCSCLAHLSVPCRVSFGPWSCLSQDLGPWSTSPLAGDSQRAAPKKKAQIDPKKSRSQEARGLGPWSACRLGTPKESRSHSRSQGVGDSKPLGLWSRASQKGSLERNNPEGASFNIRPRSKPDGQT